MGTPARLEARILDDGVPYIDYASVAEAVQRQGISLQLFDHLLAYVGKGNVKSIKSYFGPGANLNIVREGIERGLTSSQAAALTPRGQSAIQNGFKNIQYDPRTGIFTATR